MVAAAGQPVGRPAVFPCRREGVDVVVMVVSTLAVDVAYNCLVSRWDESDGLQALAVALSAAAKAGGADDVAGAVAVVVEGGDGVVGGAADGVDVDGSSGEVAAAAAVEVVDRVGADFGVDGDGVVGGGLLAVASSSSW